MKGPSEYHFLYISMNPGIQFNSFRRPGEILCPALWVQTPINLRIGLYLLTIFILVSTLSLEEELDPAAMTVRAFINSPNPC